MRRRQLHGDGTLPIRAALIQPADGEHRQEKNSHSTDEEPRTQPWIHDCGGYLIGAKDVLMPDLDQEADEMDAEVAAATKADGASPEDSSPGGSSAS